MQPPHQGPPAGGGQQSIHDMQRFQQQLQVQYRQQQVLQQQQQQQFGGTNPLQQQQQHQQVPSMQQQGQHPTMNQSSALASMMQNNSSMVGMGQQQQHMSTNSNPSTSNNNMSVNGNVSAMMNGGMMAQGNPSTFNWTNQMQQQQQPQQQQQQPQQQQQQQNQQGQSTMDASRGTSDRLMAMTGMAGSTNAFNSSGSALQNMQAALLQQQRQQAAQQQQQRNSVSGLQSNFSNSQQLAAAQALQQQQQQQQNKPAQANTSGSSSSSTANMMAGLQGLQSNTSMSSQQQILFQQHLAAMQNQQQQQMGRGGGGAGALNAMAVMQNSMQQQSGSQNNSMAASQQSTVVNNLSSLQQPQGNTPQNLMQQQQQQQSRQQQQLLQQMQQQQQQMQQRAPSNTGANTGANNNNIMQQRNSGSMLQLQNSANVLGMLQQQPQMSGMGQQQQQQTYLGGNPMGGQGDINSNSNKFGTDGANTSYGQQQHQSQGIMGSNLSEMMDNRNQHVSDASKQHQSGHFGAGNGNMSNSNNNSATNSGNNLSALDSSDGKVGQLSAEQKSFLDGRFAGGWQSNADLPDRRRVIFNILEVIKQMRPDTSKLSNKLPHMAKSLEEHLYRSAKSKADYMDLTTLKKRLQEIAHGLEIHRSSDDSAPNLKQDDFLGGVQQGGAGSDATLNQNANWNVANTVRSGVQGLSGLAAQLSGSNHNMSIGGQLASSQQMQGSSGHIGNMTQQQAGITHQASSNSNISNQATASSSTFMMPSSTLPQQSSGLWAAQNQGAGNSIMSQLQQQHLQQIGQSNTGNANSSKGMQRDEPGLGNDSMGHDANSMNGSLNGSTNFPVGRTVDSFSNAQSGLHQQGSRNQSNSMTWGSVGNTAAAPQPSGSSSTSTKFQDPTSGQKSRVISQQQQRLLLLRHASKCKAGNACTTKFCEQMVVLWRHMKTCRDKDCTTSHCLSSRCVLNHYRLCKSNGRTSTCEVCGPVMMKIKQQDREDGTTEDPLTRDSDEKSRTQSNKSSNYAASSVNQHIGSSDMSQLQQVQAQKSKLKAQLDSLKLLQGQQEQLLEQQKSLEQQAQHVTDQNSPQARQLQQQQMLLQQLQKRCEQQMLLVEQELQMQTSTMSDNHGLPMQGKNSSLNQSDNVGGTKPRANQVQLRRGSGVGKGKRFAGKSLGLSSGQGDAPGRKRRGSANKTSTAKKPKAAPKPKPEKETSEPMSPMKATEAIDHTSLVSSMTKEEIQKHLDSLNKRIVLSSRTVTHKCRPIIQELLDDQFGWVFRDAVDPVALGLPDYFDVIKNPMHLDLVAKKVDNAIYSDMESFARDVRLVFQNAILYNGESSEVGELAQSMMSKFDESHKTVVQDIECSHLNLESQGELCSLCGVQKKRFEPTVLYCQGVCGMQRIKRNASYYTDRTKQNHWCESCFGLLKPNEPILLDDGCEVKKSELQILKNDALPEEGWVNCDECHSWVHQICALFNGRTNKSTARYTCPTCYVKRPKSETNLGESTKYVKGAKDLLSCKMSDAIERGMEEALKSAYAARASELGVTVDQVEKAEGLNVRVLSNVDKKQFVGEKMIKKYTNDGCPNEYPVRTKCIALFQKRHGVDTLLFALYVYEYGHECPAPNKRRVYISYLDSVQYFEPKVHRTTAYHAVLIEYLRYVKKRGFHTAHIWSCPPTPGDDYIFYCHPKHQLVPREDMLRAWYHKALDQAKAQGVVIRTTTLYDEYFTNDGADPVPGQRRNPTCLPYFEGDYIPGEIENIIENMESGKKKGGSYTSSTQHDIVMARVGHNLKKMKDNFIVVHLRNRRFAAAVERGEDVSNWKEDSDDEVVKSKRAKISGKSSVELDISSSPKLGELTSSSGPEQQSASDTVMSTQDKLIGMGAPNKSTVEAGDEAVANHAQKAEDKMNVSGDDQGTMEMNMSSTDGQQPAVNIEKASDSSISVNAESSKPSSDSDNLNEDAKQESETRTSQISSTSVNKGAELDSKDVSVACDSASTPVPTSDDKGAGLDFNDVTVAGCSKTKLCEALSTSDGTNAELHGADAATETTVLDASPTGDDKGAELDSTNVVISTGSETKLPEASSTTYNNGSESEDVAAVGDSETKTTEVSPTSDDKGVELDSINVAAAGGSDSKIPDASSTSDDKGTESVTKDGAIGSVPDASSASGSKLASKDAGVAKSTSSNYIEPQRDTETQDGSKRQADREPKVVQQIHDNESVEVCPTSNDDTEEMVVSGAADRQSDATKQENDAPSTDEKDPKEKVANEIVAKDTPEQGTANEAGGSPERSSDVPGESNTEMDRSADKETMVKQELPTEEVVSPKDMEKTELVTATKSEEIVAGQCVSNKRVLEEMNAAVSDHFDGTVRSMSPIGDTIDEDPPLESEMFESRQQFLNYCQTTHCQFDELRRAKHSSVMVLFQLHNPMAPKFLQQCGACYRDITHGIRYHCKDCSNFDLCEDCYEPVTSGLWAKRDSRFAHDKEHSFTAIDLEAAEETQKSRAERQQSMKAHIELLEHAGTCSGPPGCALQNCMRLKKLFLHVPVCDVTPKRDCKICTRLFALATVHSRMCTMQGSCPLPFCDRIRERQRRLRKQQQLMDDRRRQAQNELYRAEEA